MVVDDTFQTSELNPALWAARAQDPGGILSAPPDLAYLISWNLPDTGFALRSGASVTGPWSSPGTPFLVGAQRFFLVNKASLTGLNATFDQLKK